MVSSNLLHSILIIAFFFTGIGYIIYKEWDSIYFRYALGKKGDIYYRLFKTFNSFNIKNPDYNPNFIINKFLDDVKNNSKNDNAEEFNKAKEFWIDIYLKYPNELIAKLEEEIKTTDIDYFEKLKYSKHPYDIETIKEKKDTLNLLIEKALIWAKTDGKIWQATRLGYFAIQGRLLEVQSDNPKDWLKVWNDELLKVENIIPLKSKILIKNPWDEGERRNEDSVAKSIEDIYDFFIHIKWKWGIREIEKNEER